MALPDWVWIEVAPGRKVLKNKDDLEKIVANDPGFAVHQENTLKNGELKYHTHGLVEDKGENTSLLPDFADQRCVDNPRLWPDYVVLPNGHHGPRPFRNKAERNEYLRLTGQRLRD